jgi:BirA family transcriptional regulator, biotin operon repressor / biotin---[acetyl-CoA-carboxylase] ligase
MYICFLKRTFNKHIAKLFINYKQMHQDFVGKNIMVFRSLDSTNDYSRQLIADQNIDDGTVIWTQFQKKGRGYADNMWESKDGENLTFSIILRPGFLDAADQFLLSMAVSLGIVDFLDGIINNVFIKWPNDIYAGKHKIAGILIENFILENTITNSIIGIGLNINQVNFGKNLTNPISIRQITSSTYDLRDCLEKLCEKIDKRYSQLKNGEKAKIREQYTDRLLNLNTTCRYRTDNYTFTGQVRGVDEFGRLAIETEKNGTRHFDLKQVVFLDC